MGIILIIGPIRMTAIIIELDLLDGEIQQQIILMSACIATAIYIGINIGNVTGTALRIVMAAHMFVLFVFVMRPPVVMAVIIHVCV